MAVLMCEGPGCMNMRSRTRLYCGDQCREAAKNARRRQKKPLLTVECRVCGETFMTRNSRQTLCDEGGYLDDRSPTTCQAMRNVVAMPKAYANTQRCHAPGCSRRLEETGAATTGRPKKFCSPRCRVRAHAAKKREASQ